MHNYVSNNDQIVTLRHISAEGMHEGSAAFHQFFKECHHRQLSGVGEGGQGGNSELPPPPTLGHDCTFNNELLHAVCQPHAVAT